MHSEQIIKYIENWAPPGAAWDKDNVGLQVGSGKTEIKNIFLCLELTEKALDQAIAKNCNFIFTHHPLIFRPLKRIDPLKSTKDHLIERIIKNDIIVYSAHTNLDFAKDGVSFELAKILKLKKIDFLVKESENQYKLVVFVPANHLKSVRNAIFNAGAGIIGEYSNCSFESPGFGTFKGSDKCKPLIGKKETFEKVEEMRLEAILNSWNLKNVVNSLINAHPYEEPAYDIYSLKNENSNFGFGVIGELQKSLAQNEFLNHVCKSLKTNNLRYTAGRKNIIKKVAVCGGSGADLLENAISQKADAFVTADIKYHPFQDADGRILFIDAGHYETEIHVLNAVKQKLKKFIKNKDESIVIYKYSGSSNPVRFYNN